MKRIVATAVIVLCVSVLYAQKDTAFNKHEIRASLGDAMITSMVRLESDLYYARNISFSYYYRIDRTFWIGGNFVNYIGDKAYYHWREYDVDGKFKDFEKSKTKYCAIIAPEIRFSFVNRKYVTLYGALSAGVGLENGFDNKEQKYPNIFRCFHVTLFGFSCNFGDNRGFFGTELGVGFKGLGSIHAGYRF